MSHLGLLLPSERKPLRRQLAISARSASCSFAESKEGSQRYCHGSVSMPRFQSSLSDLGRVVEPRGVDGGGNVDMWLARTSAAQSWHQGELELHKEFPAIIHRKWHGVLCHRNRWAVLFLFRKLFQFSEVEKTTFG